MKKIILFFLICTMVMPFSVFAKTVTAQNELDKKEPLSITVNKKSENNTVELNFLVINQANLTITKVNEDSKEVIFDDNVIDNVTINNLSLDTNYSIALETISNEMYSGTFKIYEKPNSDFIGALLDINLIDRTVNSSTDPDDDRNVMVTPPKETENNNTFKKSNKLTDIITGTINSKTDVDFFQTIFYSEGDVTFTLSNIPNGKDYDLYIYDANQNLVSLSCLANNIESVTIKNVKSLDKYYAKVIGYNKNFDSRNSYLLSANLVPKKNDIYGHTFDTAKPITTLYPISAAILFNGDNNYFKFTPPEDGTYIIYTNGVIDSYGYLYDQNQKQLSFNDDMPNDSYGNFKIKYDLKANEQYYIKVKHYSTGTGTYDLYLSKYDSNPIETDNDINNPTIVTVNNTYNDSFTNITHDNWFSFTPESTASYRIYSSGAHAKGVLYDSSKTNIIIENFNVVGTNNFELANTLVKGNTYYIKVSPNVYTLAKKDFSISVEEVQKPNDESFSEQWGMFNQNSYDINILPAWKYSKGSNVKIGVADSGNYNDHKDLKNKTSFNLSYNFIHNIKDVFPMNEPMSPNSAIYGHGTHVAGILGSETNNNIGIAGVAPESEIVPLKVVGKRLPDGSPYVGSIAAFINSITYAKENGIKSINCSFGGASPFVAEQDAMFNANDILFVIAAGNSGNDLSVAPEYPASYGHDNSLVVAAINSSGNLATFSNYGGVTDVAAPGEDIYSTLPYDEYGHMSGTSMATPFATAVTGLLWSQNPSLTPFEVKEIIRNPKNTTKLNSLDNKVYSGGLLNAFKVVTNNADNIVSTRSIMNFDESQRKIFGRDVKEKIAYTKSIIDDNLKTNQIIIKFSSDTNIDEFIAKVKNDNNIDNLNKLEYLNPISAYLFETSSIKDANNIVDILNSYTNVTYAEINYLRELN